MLHERTRESILPNLRPVEYYPEYDSPERIVGYEDGTLVVSIRHNNKAYFAEPSQKCVGKVVVIVRPGVSGNVDRICTGCKKEVTVLSIGSIRLAMRVHARELKKALV